MIGDWKDGGRPFAALEERPLLEWISGNAFRVLGLEVGARSRETQKLLRRMEILLTAGQAVEVALPVLGPVSVTADGLRGVAARLQAPRRRLLEQFLWFWSAVDTPLRGALAAGDLAAALAHAEEKAQTSDVDAVHDRALLHFLSLLGAGRSDGWFRLGEVWRAVFEHPGIWQRVAMWIEEASAAELPASTCQQLREGLAPLLLRELVSRVLDAAAARRFVETKRFIGAAHELGIGHEAVAAGLRRAADGAQARIESLCGTAEVEAHADRAQGARRSAEIATKLLDDCEPHLRLLDDALVEGDPARQGNHDRVALVALGAAVAHGNATEDWKTAVPLCERILGVAVGKDARERTEKNLEAAKGNGLGALFAGLGAAPTNAGPTSPAPASLPEHCRWAVAEANKAPDRAAALTTGLLDAGGLAPDVNVDELARAALACVTISFDKTPGWKDAAALLGRIRALRPSPPVLAAVAQKARNVVMFCGREAVEAAAATPAGGDVAAQELFAIWLDGPEAFLGGAELDEVCRNALGATIAQCAMTLERLTGEVTRAKEIAERALRLADNPDLVGQIQALVARFDAEKTPEDPRLARLLAEARACRNPAASDDAVVRARALLAELAALAGQDDVDRETLASVGEKVTDACISCGVTLFNQKQDVFPLLGILVAGMPFARSEETRKTIRGILQQAALKGARAVAQQADKSPKEAAALGRKLLAAWSVAPDKGIFPQGYPGEWRDAVAKAVHACAKESTGVAGDTAEAVELLRGASALAHHRGLRAALGQELRTREMEARLSSGDTPEMGRLLELCSTAPAAANKDGTCGEALARQILDALSGILDLVVPKATEAALGCLVDYATQTQDWRKFAAALRRLLAFPVEPVFLERARDKLQSPVLMACKETVEHARQDHTFGLEGARLLAATWLDKDFLRLLPGGLPDEVTNPLAGAIAECLRCHCELPGDGTEVVEILGRAASVATDSQLVGAIQEAERLARIRRQLVNSGGRRLLELCLLTGHRAIKEPARALGLASELLDEIDLQAAGSAMAAIPRVEFNDVMLDVVLDCVIRHTANQPRWEGVIEVLERAVKLETSASLRERVQKNLQIARTNQAGGAVGAGGDAMSAEAMRRLAEMFARSPGQ